MKRPRYRRLRKAGNRWHGKDGKSVYIVRFIRNGHFSLRWQIKLGQCHGRTTLSS